MQADAAHIFDHEVFGSTDASSPNRQGGANGAAVENRDVFGTED